MFEGLSDPSLWVAVAFVGLLALLVYYKVPGMIAGALDARADEIRKELDEARRLREDAQAVLADYQRKQLDAVKEAGEIITQAEREAEIYAEETRKALAETLERRTKLAEDKIARAEAQALVEIRAIAADAAVKAAGGLIAANLGSKAAGDLIAQTITDIKTKFN